ncbi:hypothetical protein BV898_14284 [Hypsibius exemplaris]|uniref:Uncharacterized protein n=1 Tax=Hypsibius exemplaris TaxID=2072580 RepID=A0A1W0W875_HYPEX|nr:hypothetical protein BV898_14284 [Hypsibius exemplaris]
MSRGPICCKSLCAFCKVRPYLRQPWNCCSIGAIVSLVFAVFFIPTGLTLMAFFVDYHDHESNGLRFLAWLGISSFAAGIILLSLGILLWGCVWRAYQLREKMRIHLEVKQGTLYVSPAASRFNEAKDSPMLPLRNLSKRDNKKGRHSYVDVENINAPGDVRLSKLPVAASSSRPASVQTFSAVQQQQETNTPTPIGNSFAMESAVSFTDGGESSHGNAHHHQHQPSHGRSPGPMASLNQRYSPPTKDGLINHPTPSSSSSHTANATTNHPYSSATAGGSNNTAVLPRVFVGNKPFNGVVNFHHANQHSNHYAVNEVQNV